MKPGKSRPAPRAEIDSPPPAMALKQENSFSTPDAEPTREPKTEAARVCAVCGGGGPRSVSLPPEPAARQDLSPSSSSPSSSPSPYSRRDLSAGAWGDAGAACRRGHIRRVEVGTSTRTGACRRPAVTCVTCRTMPRGAAGGRSAFSHVPSHVPRTTHHARGRRVGAPKKARDEPAAVLPLLRRRATCGAGTWPRPSRSRARRSGRARCGRAPRPCLRRWGRAA